MLPTGTVRTHMTAPSSHTLKILIIHTSIGDISMKCILLCEGYMRRKGALFHGYALSV